MRASSSFLTAALRFLALALAAAVVAVACAPAAPEDTASGGSSGSGGNASGGAGGGGGSSGGCATGSALCGGICVDITSDSRNCGGCQTACGTGQACVASACTCTGALTACGAACVDIQSDGQHCGGCGTVCGLGLVCSHGVCSMTCASDVTTCGTSCVDVMTSPTHCGTCNNSCPGGSTCSGGACACATPGQTACGGACVDTMTNTANCGACGTVCASGQTCTAGVCSGDAGTGGAGGSAGAAGAGGSGGTTNMPPGNTPGVVVSTDDAGTLGCVPLCTLAEHPDDTDLTDDWAYEGWPCVLPDSATGTRNQDCLTGQPLPPIDRSGVEGVVVDSDGDMVPDCVPLCEPGALPGSPDAPDWGWEYQATCIIRDTPTGDCNQGCTTGQPVPDPTLVQRPGVTRDEGCVAVCTCGVAGDDPSWGWEFQTTCVMPDTEVSTGLPACTTNDNTTLVPPAIAGATQDGFYTENGKLYDAKGAEFVMRGINNPHIWFDTGNQYRAYQALDRIATYKTNTIRVVWETTGGSAALLRQVLYRIVQLKMVPMVELHDVTGSNNTADLARMATYYTGADIKQVLLDFRGYVLINVANEWGATDNVSGYQSAYASAISTLRTAGLEHTIVIDADGFGQNAASLFNAASALLTGDPERNLLFSLHMYSRYGSTSSVDTVLDNAAIGTSVPFIVGEFGPVLQGQPVAWQQILTKSQSRRIGYLAWSWSGNDTETAALNIVNDFGGDLTPSWGQQVMVSHAASIQNTAAKASIFP